jgi:hypothetical protein
MYWKSFASLENKTGLGITSFGMWHGMTGHLVPNILQSSGPNFKDHKDLKTLGTKYSVMRHQNPEELAGKIRLLHFKIHMSKVKRWCSREFVFSPNPRHRNTKQCNRNHTKISVLSPTFLGE